MLKPVHGCKSPSIWQQEGVGLNEPLPHRQKLRVGGYQLWYRGFNPPEPDVNSHCRDSKSQEPQTWS